MAKGKNTVSVVTELAQPVADQMGLYLWDVLFEKEGATWYLRIFLDKKDGIAISDCENFSRAVDKLLDEADPIDQSYVLEVGSPGIERVLRCERHFAQYLGARVNVRLVRPREGERDLLGTLSAFDKGVITLLRGEGEAMEIPLSETAYVKLYDDYDMGGLE